MNCERVGVWKCDFNSHKLSFCLSSCMEIEFLVVINNNIDHEDMQLFSISLHGKKSPFLLMHVSSNNGESFVYPLGPCLFHGGVAI